MFIATAEFVVRGQHLERVLGLGMKTFLLTFTFKETCSNLCKA